MNDIKDNIAKNISMLRTERNMTQPELAKRLNYSDKSVSKWENGKGYPAIDSLKLLSSVYGVSLDELVSDGDVEEMRSARKKRSRIFYWCAVGCLIFAAAFAVVCAVVKIAWFIIPSALGVAGYVVFSFLSKPLQSGMTRADFMRYIACRAIVLLIVVAALATTFAGIFG